MIFLALKKVLAEIKQDLDSFVGNKIRLKANRGRNKVIEKVGVLEQTYPNIFVVRIDEKRTETRVSYSYTDVLTSTVELVVCHQDGDIRISGAR